MMDLDVGVVASDARDALQRGAIVSVALLADLEGRKVSPRQEQTQVVDIASGEPKYRSFSFEQQGVYEITLRSPSGVETREVTLRESMSTKFEIRSRRISQAFLSGHVFSELVLPQDSLTTDPRVGTTATWGLDNLIVRGRVLNRLDYLSTRPISDPTFSNFTDTSLLLSDVNAIDFAGDAPRLEVPRFSRSTTIAAPSPNKLNNVYFNLRGQPTDEAIPARWTNCFSANGRDLVSIPWIWFPFIPDEGRSVQVSLSQKRSSSGPTTILEVLDTKWGALLDYVTQGRMDDAAQVADSLVRDSPGAHATNLPEYALYGKLREPLVAALGGIILVSNATSVERQSWDDWLSNLAEWFPNIPDASAIYGYRLLQMGDIEKARTNLRHSVSQGLPFFSATFRLLMLGLSQLDDQESLDLISPAAAAVDVTQPFTVIHVPYGAATRFPQAERSAPVFNLTMYPATDGDCLILNWGDETDVSSAVVDLGRGATWKAVRPVIAALKNIELFAISHVDSDHVAGIVPMVREDTAPFAPRRVWFNSLQQLERAKDRNKFEAFSPREAEKLSRGIAKFGWPRNAEFESRVVSTDSPEAQGWIEFDGGLKVLLLSPDDQSLANMVDVWETELKNAGLRPFDPDIDEWDDDTKFEEFGGPLDVEALARVRYESDDKIANVTSIAFVADFDGKRVLLAGDANSEVVERRLRPFAEAEGGRFKLDLVKVSHHGSKKNSSPAFFKMIDCQNFAFSTDGSHGHGHPHPELIARILVNDPERPKTFYFNYEGPAAKIWRNDLLEKKWSYRPVFPAADRAGTIEIPI